ncbi:unnamed protein product [Clonostachys rosea f. rosea IK726]|uniref:Uncharacterized protein n=1 Tax=Clonostachys rosea f. rosea IK726 TaxID=1349383 RepID=A0ACA9T9H9_BIOOC|nr:unnamed protein product [Clonostachys rosea f. rosea IK726]
MSQQRDPYGIPINPHRSYEQYGANANRSIRVHTKREALQMNEGGGFLETRGQGYAENMTTESAPRQQQQRKTENIADQSSDTQRYGSDSRDDDMYGIGLGGGDRHHIPGDLETSPTDKSSRRQDEDLYDRDTGLQQQQQGRQQGRQQQSTEQNQKGDSMLGKMMEKTGGVLGSKRLEEQGREKRNDPRNYD